MKRLFSIIVFTFFTATLLLTSGAHAQNNDTNKNENNHIITKPWSPYNQQTNDPQNSDINYLEILDYAITTDPFEKSE